MVVIVTFVIALAATPPAMVLARRVGLLDHPGELKVQATAVPYLGGLAVAAGLAVGVALGRPSLLVPLALALALGVVDDARHIRPLTRLTAEVAVGVAAAALVPVRLPGPLGWVAVVVVVVLLVNGVNMIDGLDALAAGVGLHSALGFALVLDGDARTVALALTGAIAGFLVFNVPPAKVYLGDGGAYLIGTGLALLLALAWSSDRPVAVSVGTMPMVAVPVAELAFAVLRRIRSGKHLFAGDRSHIYDQLVQRRWPAGRAVVACVAAQGVLSVIGVGATHLPAAAAVGVIVACAVGIVALVAGLGFLRPTYSERTP